MDNDLFEIAGVRRMTVPKRPKIYHITHYENLTSIIANRAIFSDKCCREKSKNHKVIGMSEIKRRRLEELVVKCHPDTKVGEYVPFYFCPRSIMLFLMHKGNHPDIKYSKGQESIVHIQADMKAVTTWADMNSVKWALSDRNAGAYYAEFYNNMADLNKINWEAVSSPDFRPPNIKEGKQAEFLVYETFPIDLIEQIGVINQSIKVQVEMIVKDSCLENKVKIYSDWYF